LALRLLEHYDDLVQRRRETLARAAQTFMGLLQAELPSWKFTRPAGGLSVWVDTGVDAEQLAAHALRHGVTVAPGTTASLSIAAQTHLRLCFDRPALELETGVERLQRAYEDAIGRRELRTHLA
jgi:DNA-binding transcriptional MocR family regulator